MATGQPNGAPRTPGLFDQYGAWLPATNDPAFQPIATPLADVGATRRRALLIEREIPNSVVETGWAIQTVRSALQDLVVGNFNQPAQLHDAIAGDSRVQSAMASISGALLGAPIRFKLSARQKTDRRARKCAAAWERHWPQMHAEPALLDLIESDASLGFAYAQILWDTNKPTWKPYLQTFGSRFSYFHWLSRRHMAMTMDGQVPVTPGDGHWVLHASKGQYRGWMRGSLRAVAQWWLARNYALRDWARYCEMHGFPMLLADTPFGADPNDIANLTLSLGQLGQETILQLPGSVDVNKYGKYNLRYLEPADENWQAFKEIILQCNDEITLSLLGQNLTSEVKEGSFAAARVHANVLQTRLAAAARALAQTLYVQVIRPFAAINYGDAELAPAAIWDVRPQEDLFAKAKTFLSFAQGIALLRNAGVALDNIEAFAKRFGLPGMKTHAVDPTQVEARLAAATGKQEEDAPDPHDGDRGGPEDGQDDARSRARASVRRLSSKHGRAHRDRELRRRAA